MNTDINTSSACKNSVEVRSIHLKKTLLSVATISALAAISGMAVATETTATVGEWTLIKFEHGNANTFYATTDVLKEGKKTGVVEKNITGSTIEQWRKANGFDKFGTHGNNPEGAQVQDIWSLISGVVNRGANGTVTTYDNARIKLVIDESAQKIGNLDLMGLSNINGTLNLTGQKTEIIAHNLGTYQVGGDESMDAVGYDSYDMDPATYDRKVVTNFKANENYIDVKAIDNGSNALGMLTAVNDPGSPRVTVEGNLTLKALSIKGKAFGIDQEYSDYTFSDDNPEAPNQGYPLDDLGWIKAQKNVTMDIKGHTEAYGVYNHAGNVELGGQSGNVTINVDANKSYGLYATSNGVIKVSGNQATINAKGQDAYALAITDNEIDGMPYTGGTPTVVLASKVTTLNGKTSVSQKGLLEVANTVKFNADADIQGQLTAKSDAILQIADGKTLKLGTSQADKQNTFKNLTISGGSLKNASHMLVDGDLKLEGVKVANESNNVQGEIRATNKIILGNGTTFVNKGGFHAKYTVLGEGSLFLEQEKSWKQEDGSLTIQLDGITELAGGKISTIESQGTDTINTLELHAQKDAAEADPTLIVSKGDYTFDKIIVNLSHAEDNSPADIQVTGGQLKIENFEAISGNASVTDKGVLDVIKLVSKGQFNIDAQSSERFSLATFEGQQGGDFTLTGGTMSVDNLDLSLGKLTIGGSSTLKTGSDQIFTTGLGEDGKAQGVGGLKYGESLIFKADSSLTLTDQFYNLDYVASAKDALKTPTLVFSGKLVDANGAVRDEISVDSVANGVVLEETNLAATATDNKGTVEIDRSVGGQTLVVDKGNTVAVDEGKKLTLAGTADANGELVDFRDALGDKKVTAKGKEGGVTVGSTTKNNTGKLSAKVELSSEATLTAQNGTFTFADVKADSAHVNVASGSLTVEKLAVSGTSSITSAEKAETKVTELTLAGKGTTTVTGAVTADKITVATGESATVNVGQKDARGDLTVGKDSVLTGLTFFLDPTWVDGKTVTDASRLVINKTDLDGNVIVGHNSYVVLGSASDAEFVKLFQNGTLTWGKGEGKTLAAAYVAKPITVKGGSLVVDGDGDGTLEQAPQDKVDAGTVKFAKDSVLVADVTGLTKDKALITGTKFDVAQNSKAVIIGDLKNGETYKLTNADKADFWNKKDTLVSGNPLWNLSVNKDGTFGADLADAKIVFGDLMQGHAIANAGMLSDKADLKDYVNKLLTDELGKAPLDMLGARFDAAMNVAGAAATFTTAYDRASEFRDAVRGEAIAGEGNRLWAQVTGGKTKLKGIATGAQSLHVDTDAYGLVIGGDTVLNGYTLGAAFTAGKGDSENKAVGVKDDFDFYGLSVYGKTAVGGVDLVADASMTFLKSDLTMGGVADVNTDTDTTVYSMGVQAQKTFDFGVDVTPYVGLDLYHLRTDGYSNGHGADVEDANATALEIPVGATVSKAFDTASGFKLKPVFHFAIVPTVGDRDIDSKVRFAGAQSTYNFTFADDVKVRTGLGLVAEKDNFRFGFNAGYDWGNEERAATKLMLNAQYLF